MQLWDDGLFGERGSRARRRIYEAAGTRLGLGRGYDTAPAGTRRLCQAGGLSVGQSGVKHFSDGLKPWLRLCQVDLSDTVIPAQAGNQI